MKREAVCSITGCLNPVLARGWCKAHYNRWQNHGDPTVCLKPISERGAPLKWLKAHVGHEGDECLIWPFARHVSGRAHMAGGKPARIMCELAHGHAPSPTHQAAHSCGKAHEGCVNPKHLRWATPQENSDDKEIHGTMLRGSLLPQSKLTEDDIREIRRLHGQMMQKDIAKEFGVGISTVSQIISRNSWRHVL